MDVYDILRALAVLIAMPAADVPTPDESDPHLLFTEAPADFADAGWRPATRYPDVT